ncbi:hypothetical protein OGAPHI_000032 [Ogataea philodendri]|uniref:Uncharacterized protein n=1 Tax=Ogataea philodendri TaxID=1378263 RepID=A0A9P8PH25_9ASCO|nr:uncharacterized protein OGAPHI_000032 [Ogataea philodendri]KAH3671846.1 hypothetical protein OGAPHI_000032 [Ogataea philodendri]
MSVPRSAHRWKTLSTSWYCLADVSNTLSLASSTSPAVMPCAGQILLCLEGSHTAGTGRGDGLSVNLVLHVTGSKHTWNRCLCSTWLGLDVSGLVSLDLVAKHLRGWRVANGVEQTVHGKSGRLAGLDILDLKTLQELSVTNGLFGNSVEHNLELFVFLDTLLHDGGGSKVVLSDDQVDLGSVLGKEQSFFTGRVTSSNDGQRLVSENWNSTVTNGTGRDTLLPVSLFSWQVESLGRGTSGDDDGIGGDWLGVLVELCPELERLGREVHLGNGFGDDFGSESLGLRSHLLHQCGTIDTLWETREVFDFCGGCQLATSCDTVGHHTFVQNRLHLGTSEIDSSGVGSRTRPNDSNFVVDHSDCSIVMLKRTEHTIV